MLILRFRGRGRVKGKLVMTFKFISHVLFGSGLIVGTAATMLFVFAILLPRDAQALPQYAQQTGRACGSCHVNPSGGGALKPFGKQFQANGHKLPSKRK